MQLAPDDPLLDRRAAWWAKYDHAATHITRLRTECEHYRKRKPAEGRPEPTGSPGETAYRYCEHEQVPLSISLILGDVLHNLRSALDSLFLGLVRLDLGRELTEPEEHACQFPICDTPNAFDSIFKDKRTAHVSPRVHAAVRRSQPFWWLEEAKRRNVPNAEQESYDENARFHDLTAINRLSNLDKHRRLNVAAWWPGLVYWSHEEGTEFTWQATQRPPYEDGDVFGILRGTGSAHVVTEFELVLPDDPGHVKDDYASHGLPDEAERWRTAVSGAFAQAMYAFRLFETAAGDHVV